MSKEKKLLSESDVLNKIGAKDFRSWNKQQIIEFVSSIPDMDKEVAIKCIEQFPEFKEQSTQIIKELYDICGKLVEEHRLGMNEAIASYRLILDDLSKQLNKLRLSHKRKDKIISQMVEVADKIADLQREHGNVVKEALRMVGVVAVAAIGAGAALLGVKLKFFDKQ